MKEAPPIVTVCWLVTRCHCAMEKAHGVVGSAARKVEKRLLLSGRSSFFKLKGSFYVLLRLC
jgi:hypothetical protein